MNIEKETKIKILGLDQIKTESTFGDYTAFYTNVNRKKVLHHNAGKPAFITSQGKEQYFIFGAEVSKEQAHNFSLEQKEKYKQHNITGF